MKNDFEIFLQLLVHYKVELLLPSSIITYNQLFIIVLLIVVHR